jgi:nucleoside-diphosphate-sugar epimerase
VLDRDNAGELSNALGAGADVLVDTTAYNRNHGSQLIAVQGSIGRFVVISSASVYRDGFGRTLDEATQTGFPELPDPIPETHPTVDPGPATYSTRKVALERHLLDHASAPITVLRPCAIHGLNSRHPREWWFVKRMLDRRPTIPLAYRGTSHFHPSAAANIAALVCVATETLGSHVLNIADPDTPPVAEIAAFIARHLDYQGRIIELDDPSYPPLIGRTPWSLPRPFVVDCQAALALGYSPAVTYADSIGATCDWLVADAANGDWKERYPVLASYPRNHFDYTAEDAVMP